MVAKAFQSKTGGLNEKGRKKFGVKRPVKSGTNPRRVSFAARFSGIEGPLVDKKGRPTRLKLALNKWGFRNKESAKNFAARHKKS